jgi:PTH1 family peptidyl-tRNA hydrolase
MKLIVGLGNPGEKYDNTRHNIGFMAVDKLKQRLAPDNSWEKEHKHEALVVKTTYKSIPLLLAKPLTFMNDSGRAVSALSHMHKISHHDIIVIHDDLDLPLGTIKVKKDGGSAGHNGIKSIIENLGTDNFLRVRLGIGRPEAVTNYEQQQHKVVQFVLDRFEDFEMKEVTDMLEITQKTTLLLAEHGYDLFVSKYNTD